MNVEFGSQVIKLHKCQNHYVCNLFFTWDIMDVQLTCKYLVSDEVHYQFRYASFWNGKQGSLLVEWLFYATYSQSYRQGLKASYSALAEAKAPYSLSTLNLDITDCFLDDQDIKLFPK